MVCQQPACTLPLWLQGSAKDVQAALEYACLKNVTSRVEIW